MVLSSFTLHIFSLDASKLHRGICKALRSFYSVNFMEITIDLVCRAMLALQIQLCVIENFEIVNLPQERKKKAKQFDNTL